MISQPVFSEEQIKGRLIDDISRVIADSLDKRSVEARLSQSDGSLKVSFYDNRNLLFSDCYSCNDISQTGLDDIANDLQKRFPGSVHINDIVESPFEPHPKKSAFNFRDAAKWAAIGLVTTAIYLYVVVPAVFKAIDKEVEFRESVYSQNQRYIVSESSRP